MAVEIDHDDLARAQKNYTRQIVTAAEAAVTVERLCKELGLTHPMSDMVTEIK